MLGWMIKIKRMSKHFQLYHNKKCKVKDKTNKLRILTKKSYIKKRFRKLNIRKQHNF